MSLYRCCQSHCCALHGCKYGHAGCPVENGEVVQDHLCEQCSWVLEEGPEMVKALEAVTLLKKKIKAPRS